MNLRHINPNFLKGLQERLRDLNVDLGDVEVKEWIDFPYEGVQILVALKSETLRWNVDTSADGGAFIVPSEGVCGSANTAKWLAKQIANHIKKVEE